MKSVKSYLLVSVTLLLTMVSCVKETIESQSKGNAITFTLSNTSDKEQITKATTKVVGEDAYNENNIDRVDVFVYEGENCLFYPTVQQLTLDGSKVTISVPETVADNIFDKTCTIYILANCNLDRSAMENKTLTALKNLEMTNELDFNGSIVQPQSNFLMDGSVSVTITPTTNNLGKVSLKRAAAKILVQIAEAEISGYTPGMAKIAFTNYLNKTTLGDGTMYASQPADFHRSEYREIGDLSEVGIHTAAPLYSYANDWKFDDTKESYVTISIPWTKNLVKETRLYYYRIPFSYIKSAGDTNDNEFLLRRNYIYQFLINVNVLGGLDPENAVTLYPNFEVKDWTEKNVEVTILAYDFLVVYERNTEMHNITSLNIHYASSSPIQIKDLKAYCNEYATSGTVTQKDYTAGNPEFPTIAMNPDNTFTITTTIPINYVPKTITFTVVNNALLKQNVTVKVFPSKYITAQYSPQLAANDPWLAGSTTGNNNPNGGTGQTNFNLFTISTKVLSLTDVMPAGSPFFSMPITIGDPTFDAGGGYKQTLTDINSNAIMSPQFVVASQRAISGQYTYANAVLRCKGYQEYPYPRGSWRLPTAAELAYGNMLQNDPNSAVKGLFVAGNNSWWTAYNPYGFNFQSNTLVGSTANYYTRCVHDTWKDL